jgi:Type IV secretion system pilin
MRIFVNIFLSGVIVLLGIFPWVAFASEGDDAASNAATADLAWWLDSRINPAAPASPAPSSIPTTTSASEDGTSGDCAYSSGSSVAEMLAGCKPKWQISTESEEYTFSGGAKERVIQLINNIITVGSLLAVGAIVYAAILYTIAAGDDERIKSAKNALKFWIIGFVAMLLSFPMVNALVNLFYSTAGG